MLQKYKRRENKYKIRLLHQNLCISQADFGRFINGSIIGPFCMLGKMYRALIMIHFMIFCILGPVSPRSALRWNWTSRGRSEAGEVTRKQGLYEDIGAYERLHFACYEHYMSMHCVDHLTLATILVTCFVQHERLFTLILFETFVLTELECDSLLSGFATWKPEWKWMI